MYMPTKLAGMVIYLVRLLIIKSYKTLTTCSCKVTWQKSFYISITRVPMANKIGKKMTSLDELLPKMSNDPLITWSCEIRGSLTGWGSARKRLSRHQLLVFSFFPSRHFFWKDCQKHLSEPFIISYQESVWPRSDSFLGHIKRLFNKNCFLSCYSWRVWHMMRLMHSNQHS